MILSKYAINERLTTTYVYRFRPPFTLFDIMLWGSVAQWLGRLPWDPEIPGSRAALTTRWICSW